MNGDIGFLQEILAILGMFCELENAKDMRSYYVLLHNFNLNKPEKHDIMPYLIDSYRECKEKDWWWPNDTDSAPKTKKEFIHFVGKLCMYRYWARCEYEWQMIGWPPGKMETLENCKNIINSASKIDAWDQIEMNLETVTDVFLENIKSLDN